MHINLLKAEEAGKAQEADKATEARRQLSL